MTSSRIDATQLVVAAIVGMAEALGIETIAEGIETEGQLRALLSAGCAAGQGFLICQPLELARLLPWLRQNGAQRSAARRPAPGAERRHLQVLPGGKQALPGAPSAQPGLLRLH